jgi:hypothetical protein
MKTIKFILIGLIAIIVFTTIYFIMDRYIFNPNMKGISPVDLKNIGIFLTFPVGLLVIVLVIEKGLRNKGY